MELEPISPTTAGPADRFTGGVWVDTIARPRDERPAVSAGIVRFAPGARSAWHTHAYGQTLYVLDGVALIHSSEGETIVARAGQTVHTPPGQCHWHGAAPDAFMTHLALSEPGRAEDGPHVTWGSLVTDEEYSVAWANRPASADTTTKETA
ncbi:cupin domain-containing protein [Microbacteriaceae bacterium VKM Ac-2854]|nr:cupin domain-containing protein [Microbacteriaceae bacterium VKM Ac-2854]